MVPCDPLGVGCLLQLYAYNVFLVRLLHAPRNLFSLDQYDVHVVVCVPNGL